MFPGGTAAQTLLLMDNFKIEKLAVEEESKDTLENVGDKVIVTFDDSENQLITLDTAPAPDSGVVTEGIEGSSLSVVSNGSFAGVFLNPKAGLLKSGHTYKVSFDYKVNDFSDTIYFQWYNNGAASFQQFGSPDTVGTIQHFECEIVVTDDGCNMHIFPGGASALTSVLIDNIVIEMVA